MKARGSGCVCFDLNQGNTLRARALAVAGDVAVAHKWWEDALEKASASAYEQFMTDAGLQVRSAAAAVIV